MNKENKFPHLEEWCKYYYDTVGLKVHPANVPVDVVLDNIMGQVIRVVGNVDNMTAVLEMMTKAIHRLELELLETNKRLLESTQFISEILELKEDKKIKVKK